MKRSFPASITAGCWITFSIHLLQDSGGFATLPCLQPRLPGVIIIFPLGPLEPLQLCTAKIPLDFICRAQWEVQRDFCCSAKRTQSLMWYIKLSAQIACEPDFIKRSFRKSRFSSSKDKPWRGSPESVRQYGTSCPSRAAQRQITLLCTRAAEHNSSICSLLFWLKLLLSILSSFSPPNSLALTLTGAINASSKYSQPYKDFSKLRFTLKLWATSCVLNGIQMKVFQSIYIIIIIKNISKSLKWVTAFPILVLGSINNVENQSALY